MKVFKGVLLTILTVVLSFVALLAASAFKWASELPDLSNSDQEVYESSSTSQVFARTGQLIGEIVPLDDFGAGTNRVPVRLEEVSPAVLQAIIASEDGDFFGHYGFDVPGLARATYEEFFGSQGRGGSSITFQVIKNTTLRDIRDERTLERKAKELMLAIELERSFTKAEILQRYVNDVYWGGNVYGIRAAAEAYFGKDPVELSLAEGLYLARLIPRPGGNYNNFEATRAAMRRVLDGMIADSTVSRETAERAWREQIQPTGWRVRYDGQGSVVEATRTDESIRVAPSISSNLSDHVVYRVRNELTQLFTNSVVFGSGGLRVYTTVDVQVQQAANEASMRAELPVGGEMAIAAVNPETGEILAMVGEKLVQGLRSRELNRAMVSRRQPGSSFKPIVVATALEQGGYTQARTIVDERTTFTSCGTRPYAPVNYDRNFHGSWTLREHLNESYNIPMVKIIEAITPAAVRERALELGYDNISANCALALGSSEVTPMQHASAFGAFANGGVWAEPHLISRVEDTDGNVLWQAPRRESRVWSPQTAYVMLDMLRATVSEGIANRANIPGRWVGGKTGTTNDDRDLWFVGVTPGLSAAVWIGRDDDTQLLRGDGTRVTSSVEPVMIWKDFVENALRGTPSRPFPEPEGITYASIDPKTGAPNPNGARAAFVSGTEPTGGTRAGGEQIRITTAFDRRSNTRATPDTPREFIVWREIGLDTLDAPEADETSEN